MEGKINNDENNKTISKQENVNNQNVDNTNNEVNQNDQQMSGFKMFSYFMLFYFVFGNVVSYFKVMNPINNFLIDDNLKIDVFISNSLNIKDNFMNIDTNSSTSKSFIVKNKDYNYLPQKFNLTLDDFVISEDEKSTKNLYLHFIVYIDEVGNSRTKDFNRIFKNDKKELFKSTVKLLKYDPQLINNNRKLKKMIEEENYIEEIENKNETLQNSDLFFLPEITAYLIDADPQIENTVIHELKHFNYYMEFNPSLNIFYIPGFLTDFWLLQKEYKQVKLNSPNNINVTVDLRFISLMKFKFLIGLDSNDKTMTQTYGMDSTKDIFVEVLKVNSFEYLCLLFTVQVLHTLFSFLGFASDISYHKNLDKLDGLYTKIYFVTLFHYMIAIIYYYIEGVSKMIYLNIVIGLIIEIWKFRKIYEVSFSSLFPFISFKNKIKFEESESISLESEAVTITSKFLFIPLGVGYLLYKIYYNSNYMMLHPIKFTIEYFFFLLNIFGFVLMTPQIYINYKLKSVEHMPYKTLAYKFLNTIIDDLFAFALDTPTLHRVSVFKDDVIFVIFLIQLFLYRGNKRVNKPIEITNSENSSDNIDKLPSNSKSIEEKKND